MSFEKLLKPTMRGVQPTPEIEEEKPNFLVDTLLGVPRGIEGAVQSLYDLADFATGDVLPDYDTRFLGRSKRFGGTMTEGITQFLTGFIPVAGQLSKVGKLSKLTKTGKRVVNLKGAATAGAVADFTMFQAQEERLSNLIEAFPSLSNPVTEYLEADGDDGELEGRLKNTIEGLAIGGLVDSLVGGVKAIKRSRKGDDPESIIGDFYDSYNQQKNDELLTQDTLETESFRETIDKAFEAKFGGTIVNEGTPVNAYDALQTFDEVYTGELKPIITALLDRGANSLRKTELHFSDTTLKGKGVGSTYGDNVIKMRQGGARTFVHEMLHAVTVEQLDSSFTEIAKKLNLENPDNMMAGRLVAGNKEALELIAKNAEADPVAGLANAYLKVIKALGREDSVFGRSTEQIKKGEPANRETPYGLTNIEEFITEAFTNPEFRKILAELPSETQNRSMFEDFLDSLLRILGLDKSQGSVLRDVFKYTDDIVQKQNAEYADALDYIESFSELSRRIKRNADEKPTGKPDSYYDDLYESGEFGQDRKTLDDRGEDFEVPKGERNPVPEIQKDDLVPVRGRTLEPFEIKFGRPFKGKDISEVPNSYLKKALEFDSIPEKTKTRINEELDAREAGEAPRPDDDFVPEKTSPIQRGVGGKLKAARLMVARGRAEIDSPLTKEEILEPNVATARERYQRYVAAQGGTGGKASPASMSFKEYMENYGITHTTVLNKRGKVIGSKETDEFTSAKFRKEARKFKEEGGFGQDSIDDFIQDRINQTSREIGDVNTTGGRQAILNMAKNIRTSKHALALISGIARNLNEKGVKQKVTKEELAAETEKTADILGGDKNTWLTAVRGLNDSIPDLQQFRDAQRAAKTLMDLMSRNIVETARKAVEARTSDALNLQRLETEFISKLDQLTEVQRIYSLMGREAGLTLLQRNFLGNAKGKYRLNDNVGFDFVAGDPESYARYTTQSVGGKNVKETINEFVMYGTDEQVQRGVAEIAAGDELTRGVVKGAKGMFGSKLMRMTTEYWINSLLSGPTTQFVNFIGSGLTTAIRMSELAMGSIMAGDSATRRAIFQYAFSMESIAEAFKFARKSFRINDSVLVQGSRQFDDQLRRNEMITGENVMETLGRGRKALGGAQDAVSGAIDFIGKGVRLPSRGLMSVDEFFKQLNYRTYVRTNLAMQALSKNPELTGKELAKIVSEDFDKYITDGGRAYNEGNLYLDAIEKVKGDGIEYGSDQAVMIQQELARNPFDPSRSALSNAAKNYAEVNTFTNELDNDTVVGKVGNMLGNAKQELGGLNFIIPFVRTPTNILQFSLDRTPLGLAQRAKELIFRKEELTEALASKNPMEVALAKGKIATGVAFSSAMLWYALSNKEFITGHGPQNKDEKDALKASGWQPYSFRIPNFKGGHNYFSYQRLDPVATIIGLFADMAEFEEYHDLDGPVIKDLFAMTALSFTQNVTNKSYVKGLDTLLNAFKDPVNNAQGVAGNIVGGFMPSFIQQMQNANGDRTLRETRTVFDYFVARGTGAEDLPARRNFLGEAQIVKNPKLFGAINPVYFSPESKDPVDQELKSLLHGFSKPNSKLMGAIQLKDIYNEDGRQAYDVWLEKTSTTKIGGKTLRQYLHKMIKSKEYQALPAKSQSDIGEKSPRIKAINSWLRAFRAQAKQEMIEEFPELQNSLNELLQQKQQYRLIQ